MSAPLKHSVTLRGHRTSVSLEDEFWSAFCAIARERSMAINALASEVDETRAEGVGLATAIRLFVLAALQAQAAAPGAAGAGQAETGQAETGQAGAGQRGTGQAPTS